MSDIIYVHLHNLWIMFGRNRMETTPGREFYEQHIAFLEAEDVRGLMGQYHEDAVLVTFERTVPGRGAIREYMTEYLDNLGSFTLKATNRFRETDDALLFEVTVVTTQGEARMCHSFVLRDGKATHHFFGMIDFKPFA